MEEFEHQHHDQAADAALAGSGSGSGGERTGWIGALLAVGGFLGFWVVLAWVLISTAGPA